MLKLVSWRFSAGSQWAGGCSEGCKRTTVQAIRYCSHKWVAESEPKLDCRWGRFLGFDGCEWIQTRQVQTLLRITCAGCSHPHTAFLLLFCVVLCICLLSFSHCLATILEIFFLLCIVLLCVDTPSFSNFRIRVRVVVGDDPELTSGRTAGRCSLLTL